MKHYNFIICILLSSLGCISCIPMEEDDNTHFTISFYNNSDRDLYVIDLGHSYYYYTNNPDTTVYINIKKKSLPDVYKVKSFGLNKDALDLSPYGVGAYESLFEDNSFIPNYTVSVYIADADSVDENDENLLLARYDLKLEDLQRCNWVLSYPPHEGMRNIKMWPEFQQIYKPQD